MAITFVCPKCHDGSDIHENNIVHVRLQVTEWVTDPDAWDFGEPDDFGRQSTVDDTIRTVEPEEAPRWYCGNCFEEFETLEQQPPEWDGQERRSHERRSAVPQVLVGEAAVKDPQFRRTGDDRRKASEPGETKAGQ